MTGSWVSLPLGALAGLANLAGGLLLLRRAPSATALRSFVALGAGFMLSAALLEMVPESFALRGPQPAMLILVGYCAVHLLEHTVVPHLHFGAEVHDHELLSSKTGYSVLLGLATHTFFDGVAIGSGVCAVQLAGLGAVSRHLPAQDSRGRDGCERDAGSPARAADCAALGTDAGSDNGGGGAGDRSAPRTGPGSACRCRRG